MPKTIPDRVTKHWNQLRADYVNATPRQRLGPIVDRLLDPFHWGPNLLVTRISAVEAFARSLVVELLARSMGKAKMTVYEDVRVRNGPELVQQYLCLRGLGQAPSVFGAEQWTSYLEAATKYRHLLLHECTYLNAAKLQELNTTCETILGKLVDLAGHMARYARLVADSRRAYRGLKVTLP